jgi:hypothetical protein
MAARREITEGQLTEYSRCLMRDPVRFHYLAEAHVLAYELFAKRIVFQVFDEEVVPDVAHMRATFETAFREIGGEKISSRLVLRAARRMRDLLSQWRIYLPVTPYVLNLGKAAISGEYAVLISATPRKIVKELAVLRLRDATAPHLPSVVSHARWLHLRNVESSVLDIRVVNFSLLSEQIWKETFSDERQIRGGLTAFVDHIVHSPGHPAPGAYCNSCLSHGCLKAAS